MSVPSRMLFYNDNEEIVDSSIFINCGWFYEGMLSALKVMKYNFIENNQIDNIPIIISHM